MKHFDRFERDLVRRFSFNCVYCLIVFVGLPLVFVYAFGSIFGWSTSSVGEMLASTLNISWIIAALGTLGGELLELKCEVEQLKTGERRTSEE